MVLLNQRNTELYGSEKGKKIRICLKTIPLVSRYKTDKEAKEVEYRLQKALNAHKNPMYINESLATINGFMGRNVSGKDNPFYGKTHSDEFSIKHSARMSGTKNPMYGRTGDNCPNGRLIGKDNPFYGKTHSKSTKIVCGIKNRKSLAWNYEYALRELWLKLNKPKVSVFKKKQLN